MFVETEERKHGEITEAPEKVLKLSEAMREGSLHYDEERRTWFESGRYCAICTAIKQMGGDVEGMWRAKGFTALFDFIIEKTGISRDDVELASAKHNRGESRESIADWLESKGY